MTDDDCEWVCLTVPASAVVAALAAWHDDHEASARALEDVVAIPAHVMVETYSVLTRLPAGLAVPAAAAARVLGSRFHEEPLRLSDADRRKLPEQLAEASVF
ncbi:MAG: PIN domain-containing protein [Thermoleophilaceae bacterium]